MFQTFERDLSVQLIIHDILLKYEQLLIKFICDDDGLIHEQMMVEVLFHGPDNCPDQ